MTLSKEPATIISALTGLITAVIGLLVAFGIDVSEEQRTAIIATVTSLSGVIILVGPIIRQFVTPVDKAEAAVKDAEATAYKQGKQDGSMPPDGGAKVDLTTHAGDGPITPL